MFDSQSIAKKTLVKLGQRQSIWVRYVEDETLVTFTIFMGIFHHQICKIFN